MCWRAVQAYIEQKLNPTLLKALSALAKEKPTSSPQDAVIFLANWLLDHNPNKPRVAVPEELLLLQKQQLLAAQEAAAAAAAQAAAAAKQRTMQKSASSSVGRLEVQHEVVQDSNSQADDSSAQDAAATKVQAAFRGHQARKHVAEMRHAADPAPA
jgi:nucleoside-diphosphate kinase